MLLETSRRRVFREKVDTYNLNRTPSDKRLDAKRSDTQKVRAGDATSAVGVPGNGCVLDRTTTPTSRSNGRNKQRIVVGRADQGHPSGRVSKRQATTVLEFSWTYRNASSGVGGTAPPYVQREVETAGNLPREGVHP